VIETKARPEQARLSNPPLAARARTGRGEPAKGSAGNDLASSACSV